MTWIHRRYVLPPYSIQFDILIFSNYLVTIWVVHTQYASQSWHLDFSWWFLLRTCSAVHPYSLIRSSLAKFMAYSSTRLVCRRVSVPRFVWQASGRLAVGFGLRETVKDHALAMVSGEAKDPMTSGSNQVSWASSGCIWFPSHNHAEPRTFGGL